MMAPRGAGGAMGYNTMNDSYNGGNGINWGGLAGKAAAGALVFGIGATAHNRMKGASSMYANGSNFLGEAWRNAKAPLMGNGWDAMRRDKGLSSIADGAFGNTKKVTPGKLDRDSIKRAHKAVGPRQVHVPPPPLPIGAHELNVNSRLPNKKSVKTSIVMGSGPGYHQAMPMPNAAEHSALNAHSVYGPMPDPAHYRSGLAKMRAAHRAKVAPIPMAMPVFLPTPSVVGPPTPPSISKGRSARAAGVEGVSRLSGMDQAIRFFGAGDFAGKGAMRGGVGAMRIGGAIGAVGLGIYGAMAAKDFIFG